MKIHFLIPTLLVSVALCRGQQPSPPQIPPPPPAKSLDYYRAGEIDVDAFGAVRTTDFSQHREGIGFGANYFLSLNSGVRVDTFTSYLGGKSIVDELSVDYVYRIPVGRSAPYALAGWLYEFEHKEWGIKLGIGIEHRLTPHLAAFTDVSMVKEWSPLGPAAEGRVGVRWAF